MLSSRSLAAAAIGAAALAGCGASAAATPAPSCAQTVNRELTDIARNIYAQEVHGRDVVGAVRRVEGSQALAAAVERDDAAATRQALQPLLRADIRHIEIFHGTHRLVSFGHGAALGPVHGTLSGGGSFTLATGTDAGLASLIEQLTGAQVRFEAGAGHAASTSLAAEAYPSGPLRIDLVTPPVDPAVCGASAPATVADTVGAVGQRLFAAESSGARTRHVLKVVAGDPRFVRAVERRDPAAVRAQIVRCFEDPHLHVVRIRAHDARGHLIDDLGGPYVLAPATTVVRSHGKKVGTVTLSTQDDSGYIKLMHRFTGAVVILRSGKGEVPGSNAPAAGRNYEDFGFDAKAFPSGPLRIELLTDPPGQWSAPAPVAGPRTGAPTLAFDADGLGLLAADTGDAAPAIGPHDVGSVFDGSAFGPLTMLTPDNVALSGAVAPYAKTRVAALGTRFERTRDRVELRFGAAGHELTDAHPLGPSNRHALSESLTADNAGGLAASYGTCLTARACGNQALYLVTRAAHSIRIARDADGWISTTAVDDRGDALVVWQGIGGVYARLRTGGGTLEPTQHLGNPGEPVTALSAVLTRGGAAVAWAAQNVDEGVPRSAATVDATFASAGHHFHSPQRLTTVPALTEGHDVGERRVKLTDDGGMLTAAWTAYQNGHFVVQRAQLAGFRFGTPQTVSDPTIDSVLADAAGPGLLWRTGVAGNDPAAGPQGLSACFGSGPEPIEQGTPANNATLRMDPVTGQAVAAWSNYPGNDLESATRAAPVSGSAPATPGPPAAGPGA